MAVNGHSIQEQLAPNSLIIKRGLGNVHVLALIAKSGMFKGATMMSQQVFAALSTVKKA